MCTGARLLGGTLGGTEGCRSGTGRLLAASQKTLCLPSSPPYPRPPPSPFLLQLIPHFLSKIPRELLVCVFPQHVLICHPRSLAELCSAGVSGASSLQLAAVPRPGQWCHQQGQVPPAPHPHRLSPCLSSPFLHVPKAEIFYFYLFFSLFSPCSGGSGPPREWFWRGCGRWPPATHLQKRA